MLRVWVDERVERGADERPVLGTGVLPGRWRGRLTGGLGERFGVQVGQMLGAAEQRSERIVTARASNGGGNDADGPHGGRRSV